MPVAFVLSGGASLGAAQAGMLRALYERGIRPDLLVGTSAGAINAAFVSSRRQTLQTAHELERVWRGLSRAHLFPANPLTAGLGLLGLRDHSVPAGSLRRLVSRHLEIERLEQATVPLHVVATDALSGEEVLLSEGPAVDAILASAATPGVFPAVRWGLRLLIDGAVVNNTPISHAVELGADQIVVLAAMGDSQLMQARHGVLGAGVTAVAWMISKRLEEDLIRYAGAAELIVLPSPAAGILPTDFGHADELIAECLATARATLLRKRRLVPVARAA
jgi:NTE family protein